MTPPMKQQLIDEMIERQEERYSWLKDASEKVKRWKAEDARNGIFWANASGTALVGKPEPESLFRLGPLGDHRLSQGEDE